MSDVDPDATAASVDTATPTERAAGEAGSMASLLRGVAATGGGGAIAPGTLIGGQYLVERTAGVGGMGVVYLARDQRLERPVAIKLGAARSAVGLARLQREAGALAKLSHPNVVVVYQVGEHDGRVYIAMEYVAGGTARSWVMAQPRGWREVIALYAAAGDGLAAAHAAGLIHRDVKPDNVLVGDDGRPRVADFGLVRAIATTEVEGDSRLDTSDLAQTRAGSIVGTPAYMSPEQLAGDDVDARADQFSFCASLWEALHGARPFSGATPAEVKAAIESSPPAIGDGVEARRRVPRHLLEVLRRGLRPARDERWPTMTSLLAALRHDPAARRRRVGLVLGGAAVAAAIAIPLVLRAGQAPDPCTDGAALLAPTWSADRSARLEQQIGPTAWPVLQTRIGAYARAWTIGHRDACRATRVARSQSEDLLDRRMRCLHGARIELDATLAVLERGGAAVAASAADAIGGLPELAACADTATLADQVPLPTDPAARAKVDEADVLLAEARAADLDRGQLDPIGKTERALTAARAGGWKPQLALALATHASVLDDAGRGAEARPMYQEAARVALAGRSDATAARTLADLAWSLSDEARPAEAALVLDLARAIADRGTSDRVMRRVLGAAAMLAMRGGRGDEAVAIRRELVAMTERDPEAAPDWPASDQFNLAAALLAAGQPGAAEVAAARAVELAERNLGSSHPTLGRYLGLLANTRKVGGKLAEAATAAERALAILEAWYGADDVRLSDALDAVASVRRAEGNNAAARALWERQLALARIHIPADVPMVQTRLAIILLETGDLVSAAAAAADVVAAIEHSRGPSSGDLMDPLLVAAVIAREQGRVEASVRDFRRALALGETNLGTDHPSTHNLRIELGKSLVLAREAAEARVLLERVVAATAAHPDFDPSLAVEGHLVLADVHLAVGDRARAGALAATAAALAAAAPGRPDLVALSDAWRAAHPMR